MSTYSATEVMGWLRCRYQHDFSSFNRMGLTPIVTAHYFNLGTCIHAALAEWALKPDASLPQLYMAHSLAIRQQQIDDFTTRIGVAPTQSDFRELDKSLETGLAMMINYENYWKTPFSDGWIPISMEQTLTIPIPNTKHFLECTLDGIITNDGPKAEFAIVENKTYSRHPNSDMLYRNFQFKCYTWAALQANIGNLIGVAYNGMWTRPNLPTGRVWADMFHREMITFSNSVLEQFEDSLIRIVTEMSDVRTQLYEHIPWDGCRCSYKELCDLRLAGQDYSFVAEHKYKKRDKTPAWMEQDD